MPALEGRCIRSHMVVEGACTQAVTSNGAADGICNENLPNDSVYKRFLYFVSALAHNGFYIAIDNHVVYDTSYQNPTQWAAMWAQVTIPKQASICLPTWLCSKEQENVPPATFCCLVHVVMAGSIRLLCPYGADCQEKGWPLCCIPRRHQ